MRALLGRKSARLAVPSKTEQGCISFPQRTSCRAVLKLIKSHSCPCHHISSDSHILSIVVQWNHSSSSPQNGVSGLGRESVGKNKNPGCIIFSVESVNGWKDDSVLPSSLVHPVSVPSHMDPWGNSMGDGGRYFPFHVGKVRSIWKGSLYMYTGGVGIAWVSLLQDL